jgi:hypothetical protein
MKRDESKRKLGADHALIVTDGTSYHPFREFGTPSSFLHAFSDLPISVRSSLDTQKLSRKTFKPRFSGDW